MWKKTLYIIYQPYKWLIFFPVFSVTTVMFGIIAFTFSTLINQKIGSYFGGVIWSRFSAFITPMFVKVTGKENIERNASYVVMCNHRSYYDIFVIYGWLGLDIKFVMKKELAKLPGIGFGSKKVGHIFIDRSNKRVAIESLNRAKEKLKNGTSVIIFPEGTRSKDGVIGTFKRGGFKLALDLNLPILPVSVTGTEKILPAGTANLLPGRAKLTIHKPVVISGYDENTMNDLMEKIKGDIQRGLIK